MLRILNELRIKSGQQFLHFREENSFIYARVRINGARWEPFAASAICGNCFVKRFPHGTRATHPSTHSRLSFRLIASRIERSPCYKYNFEPSDSRLLINSELIADIAAFLNPSPKRIAANRREKNAAIAYQVLPQVIEKLKAVLEEHPWYDNQWRDKP
jgi:hypothetical protein